MANQSYRVEVEKAESAPSVGAPISRIEDLPYITGQACYVDDVKVPNCLHLVLLRSSYAHARIRSIDVSSALKAPGIVAVLDGNDVRKICKPIYHAEHIPGSAKTDAFPLAVGKVRFVGEPIVAVVATSREAGEDALGLISVDYEPLPVVVDAESATKAGAPLLYEEWGNNLMLHHKLKGGDPESAFAEADYIIKEVISCHRHSPSPMETNCYLANYGQATGLTLWASTQQPHVLRVILAETLDLPEGMVRVIQPDVGGGFGGKGPVHHEEILVCVLSVHLRRPVKYFQDRTEHLIGSHQAREQTHFIEVGVKKSGVIVAIRDRVTGNMGAYFPTAGLASLLTSAVFLTGCYRIENFEADVFGVVTNKPPYGAYRGFGKDAANYVIERVMDIVARRLGIDPVELRLRNTITPADFPYRSITGALYEKINYAETLRGVTKLSGYAELRRRQATYTAEGRCIGVGLSLVLEPASAHVPGSFSMGFDGSTVRLEPSGRVTVITGVTSSGTGTKTAFAQIVSDELGVPIRDLTVIQGDTSTGPFGYGMWASRSIVVGGNSVLLAARRLKGKLFTMASRILHADGDNLRVSNGIVYDSTRPNLRITLRELASAFYKSLYLMPVSLFEGGLEETAYYAPPNVENEPKPDGFRNLYSTYGNSACVAVVEVDVETGLVKVVSYYSVVDAGRVINPTILEGQVHGGVVQGIGGVVYEENSYDEDGQPLATTFMDYLIPTSMESPELHVRFNETISHLTPLGARGAGEGPIEGVYAAVVNAVEDALGKYDVSIRVLPLKPENVWKEIKGKIK